MHVRDSLILSFKSIVLSYAQIFFTNKAYMGMLLLAVSFFIPSAGIAGLIAVISTNTIAFLMGINRQKIATGHYGFNPLLVGLGLGVYYQFNWVLLLVLFFASLLTFLLTLFFEGWLAKYRLPFLSLPFLFALWIVTLASQQFTGLQISELGVFSYNEISRNFNQDILNLHLQIQDLDLPLALKTYFLSLAAIFFQYNIYAGVVIAIGILLVSRISFMFTLTGFFSAYLYYHLVGADFTELEYSYIGFNYILTAIAIGAFFILPSIYSIVWVMLLTPLISFIMTSSNAFLELVGLGTYALPFNVVTILFLYALAFRERPIAGLQATSVQHFSPEHNLYYHINHKHRFGNNPSIAMSLPFFGTWKINQDYQGDYTHKGKWRHALDFVIEQDGDEFQGEGKLPEEYYCYDKIVLAPADGVVEIIEDGIPDNKIGDVNLKQNWGNSIILRHDYKLYTQLSHLKAGSFLVSKGEYVKRGQALARIGNSGRSPYPHLHFQVQSNPYVGSQTMEYPFSNYMIVSKTNEELQINQIPTLNQEVKNVETDESLQRAFGFIPGQELHVEYNNVNLLWKVEVDYLNNTYLFCTKTKSKAFFYKTDNRITFTGFKGTKKSLLYKFYLSAYHVIFTFNEGLEIKDYLPAHTFGGIRLIIQDFVAPFHIFLKPSFTLRFLQKESYFDEHKIQVESIIQKGSNNAFSSIFTVNEKGLSQWKLDEKGTQTEIKFVQE
jgi:urea transporter